MNTVNLKKTCGKSCCFRNNINIPLLLEMLTSSFEKTRTYSSGKTVISEEILKHEVSYIQGETVLYNSSRLSQLPLENEIETILSNVWTTCDVESFPILLIEKYIMKMPSLIEYDILLALKNVFETDAFDQFTVWTQSKEVLIIQWCSISRNIFCLVSNILHQIMLKIMLHRKHIFLCIQVISSFVLKVMKSCEKRSKDYISLYPQELQPIATVLEIDPNYLFQSGHELFSSLILQLENMLNIEPIETLMLLSHFHKWVPFLMNTLYCAASDSILCKRN